MPLRLSTPRSHCCAPTGKLRLSLVGTARCPTRGTKVQSRAVYYAGAAAMLASASPLAFDGIPIALVIWALGSVAAIALARCLPSGEHP